MINGGKPTKMDRSQIRNLIESGRAAALDCYSIGKTIPDDDPVGTLFKTDILNKSVILKRYEKAAVKQATSRIFAASMMKGFADSQQPVVVSTVVYFPYDIDNIYDGGESLVYTGRDFLKTLARKLTNGSPSPDIIAKLSEDGKTLNLLDSMHSLDPFLFRCKVEQRDAMSRVHESYFAVSEEEWNEIQFPIHEKIMNLVSKALLDGGSDGASGDVETDHASRQDYVERFLQKIWEARDVEGIETFVRSMQIDLKKAPEVFFAWKAICYYQVRFASLIASLKTMFQWVGSDDLCFPTDPNKVPPGQMNALKEERSGLREKMRDGYVAGHKVLGAYEDSYTQFIDEGRPEAFIEFLAKAENSYLLLANHVSVATHAVNLWRSYMEEFGPHLRYEQFEELFDGLLSIYAVERV